MIKKKLIRTATISISLNILLKGQLRFLSTNFDVLAVSGLDNSLTELIERENVGIRDVAMQRNISPYKDMISLIKLYRLFRKEKPHIVHSITPKAGLLSMVAAKYAGVPVRIHTFTGLIFPYKTGIFQKILILMDKLLCWHATAIFPEGNGVKQDLLKFGITSKPLKIIANGNVNGVDLEYFSKENISFNQKEILRDELNIKTTDVVFIFVGRLVTDKGINELVTAFKLLSSEFFNVKLLLVGTFEPILDPLNPETLAEIDTNKSILPVGFQSDVRLYYAISNCLAFPSYREGFPNVVLQAGAMGMPSIVTNISGCNEIIKENFNGWIVPTKDSQSLYNKMKNFILEEKQFELLKQNARKNIHDNFSQELVWNGILKEYESLCNSI